MIIDILGISKLKCQATPKLAQATATPGFLPGAAEGPSGCHLGPVQASESWGLRSSHCRAEETSPRRVSGPKLNPEQGPNSLQFYGG